MKKCYHYPSMWYCDKNPKTDCSGCSCGVLIDPTKEPPIFCPYCDEDITADVSEFVFFGTQSNIMMCPRCQANLVVRIVVEKEAEDSCKEQESTPAH